MKFIWSLLLCGSVALAAESDDAASELASFQVADGFEVNLFASEADGLIKPIQMRFDTAGRLWVIGSSVYPQLQPGQKADDKVLVLEDRDRDGRVDRVTHFAGGLMIPTGIELTSDGAYVGHGTELLLLRDTDGDLKADTREVVLRGFGTGDNHQNINSFRWGPGGELWMSQGLHIHSSVETPWGTVRLDQAGIWRFNPRRLKLEGFFGSQHEPQNPWGFVFTDWGEPVVLAGNNSSPIYPVPGLVSRRRLDLAPPLIWKTGNGRKVSGGDIVGTTHFPDAWQGALILGGYLNNAVWAVKLADDGSGFRFEDLPPLIKSTHRSFRPVDVRFGPDGALYICDWYNPIIGHYQASFRHPDRDKKHGRIWRVTAKGRSLTKPADLMRASVADLIVHLESADRWTREFAKRVLGDKPPDQVIPVLRSWTPASELGLKEALGVLQNHEAVAPDLLARLAQAKDAGARAYAAHVVGLWADRFPEALTILDPLFTDPSARVRLQALIAATYIPRAEAMEAAAAVTDLAMDRFLEYGWRQAVYALKPHWLPALQAGRLVLKAPHLRSLALADGTSDVLMAVRRLIDSAPADSRLKLMETLAEIGDASDYQRLLQGCTEREAAPLIAAINNASRARKVQLTNAQALLARFVQSAVPAVQGEALKLAGAWKLNAFRGVTEKTAKDPSLSSENRRAAILALADFGGTEAVAHLSTAGPPIVQSAAVAALCQLDFPQGVKRAAEVLPKTEDDQAITEILSAVLKRKDGAAVLAKHLASVSPRVAAIGLALMNSSGRREEVLARVLEQAIGKSSAGGLKDLLPAEVTAEGDAARGAKIFRRAELGCLACHAVGAEGGSSGPSLSALGTAQPIDFIIGAILEPQREIKEGYTSISITARNRDEFQGYVVRETSSETVIRDFLQNREIRLAKDDIAERRSSGSIMPSGLVDTLTREEFRDLVRYLSELGQAK